MCTLIFVVVSYLFASDFVLLSFNGMPLTHNAFNLGTKKKNYTCGSLDIELYVFICIAKKG